MSNDSDDDSDGEDNDLDPEILPEAKGVSAEFSDGEEIVEEDDSDS